MILVVGFENSKSLMDTLKVFFGSRVSMIYRFSLFLINYMQGFREFKWYAEQSISIEVQRW